ncbi:MAG TPA: CaiB/BaiF CoA-transferase family protein [Acidimicrobiia bacterium]
MGPLEGLLVVELAGLGPGPFCAMVLADLGADVMRVDRVESVTGGHTPSTRNDLLNRGKRSVAVDLKQAAGVEVVLGLVAGADALIEGYRPGVTERLGLGPAECLARNPDLVYGRMTGWGQTGPMAGAAGHDIDYIALSGALGSIGTTERPIPPLNLVGDFGGGGLILALGVVSAILWSRRNGVGQVVDAAMTDGSALLMTSHHGYLSEGWWVADRESNLFDGAAPFYTTYPASDGRHLAVGALEPRFYAELLQVLDLDPETLPDQLDRTGWPRLRQEIGDRFASRTREEWERRFDGTDACVVAVLDMAEAPGHPHNLERATFVEVDGITQPAPAPRFSGTPAEISRPPGFPGEHTDEIVLSLGYSRDDLGMLRRSGAIA